MPFVIAALLVAYNNAINLWRPFRGPAYVPANLLFAFVVFLVAGEPIDAGARWWEGAALGLAGAGALGVALVVRPRLVADARYAGMRARALADHALVRIPIGTALVEEALFRGALFGALRPDGVAAAVAGSSIAFGLWHVVPTAVAARANRPGASRAAVAGAVAAGVVVTGAAGILFALLRERGGGIASPFALHAIVNVAGALVARAAHRRA